MNSADERTHGLAAQQNYFHGAPIVRWTGNETQQSLRLLAKCVCARARVYQFKSSKQSPRGDDSFSLLFVSWVYRCVYVARTKNPVRVSSLTFFQFSMCARGFAGIDSGRALGQKPKVSAAPISPTSEHGRQKQRNKSEYPAQGSESKLRRIAFQWKKSRLKLATADLALASNCFWAFYASFPPLIPIEKECFIDQQSIP